MPLISPNQLYEVLSPSKMGQNQDDPKAPNDLRRLLNKSGLSREEVLENIASLMRMGETDNVKLQAAKIGAQVNGLLSEEDTGRHMNVTIVINDSQYASVNPILIPR